MNPSPAPDKLCDLDGLTNVSEPQLVPLENEANDRPTPQCPHPTKVWGCCRYWPYHITLMPEGKVKRATVCATSFISKANRGAVPVLAFLQDSSDSFQSFSLFLCPSLSWDNYAFPGNPVLNPAPPGLTLGWAAQNQRGLG